MKGVRIEVESEKPFFLYRSRDVKNAIAYTLYNMANPDSEMCVPNCAYEKAEKLFDEWVNDVKLKKAVEFVTKEGNK